MESTLVAPMAKASTAPSASTSSLLLKDMDSSPSWSDSRTRREHQRASFRFPGRLAEAPHSGDAGRALSEMTCRKSGPTAALVVLSVDRWRL